MNVPVSYHYCSLDTACAILGTGSLRLSDITKSNDSSEIAYGYAAAIRSLIRCGLVREEGSRVHFLEDWIGLLRPDYRTMLADAITNRTQPPNRLCYAICFSEHHDLLSQWRAYGDDGRGVALGFDLSAMESMPPTIGMGDRSGGPLEQHAMVLYEPIVYGKDRTAALFDGLADDIRVRVERLRHCMAEEGPLARDALLEATLLFVTHTAFCKKRFFREEREWRLALWGPRSRVTPRQAALSASLCKEGSPWLRSATFRVLARGDRLVPVVDLGMDMRTILREIVIGPRCRADESDLALLLEPLGLEGIRIRRSAGTYQR
ncbi:DUF2971 domain-containing protein [Bifidobacterium cuniculi]|uniref:DUF2971 domain-containing protein n=1 Tax=Bifidobacterium cuniculi TaxID=1688 RepID=A0A087AW31_9BIFI|nr:DUF2971 domain-containing protein [Bifidobacterium cuniculi]KFI62981.1 hypothetical protein BCUN_0814 [Bifidobacterium cuniculi]